MISYSATITDKAGREVRISGSSDLIDTIGEILEANGFRWNDQVECWDQGFYDSTPPSNTAKNPIT